MQCTQYITIYRPALNRRPRFIHQRHEKRSKKQEKQQFCAWQMFGYISCAAADDATAETPVIANTIIAHELRRSVCVTVSGWLGIRRARLLRSFGKPVVRNDCRVPKCCSSVCCCNYVVPFRSLDENEKTLHIQK